MADLRQYEAMLIFNPEIEEEARDQLIERTKNNITENGGEIIEIDEWGTRELAYEINDFTTGYYTAIQFHGNGDVVEEIEYDFRILDSIIRFLVVRQDN